MGQVVDLFKAREQKAAAAPAPADPRTPLAPPPRDEGPAIRANAQMLGGAGLETLAAMDQQGAAMKVLSALLFYAHQGNDGGRRARSAVVAMQEILGGPPDAA